MTIPSGSRRYVNDMIIRIYLLEKTIFSVTHDASKKFTVNERDLAIQSLADEIDSIRQMLQHEFNQVTTSTPDPDTAEN